MKSLRIRVERLRDAAVAVTPDDRLDVVVLCPVAETSGLLLGLHRDGPRGSTAGVYVYDPAAGEPQVPRDRRTSSALIIGGDARPI